MPAESIRLITADAILLPWSFYDCLRNDFYDDPRAISSSCLDHFVFHHLFHLLPREPATSTAPPRASH